MYTPHYISIDLTTPGHYNSLVVYDRSDIESGKSQELFSTSHRTWVQDMGLKKRMDEQLLRLRLRLAFLINIDKPVSPKFQIPFAALLDELTNGTHLNIPSKIPLMRITLNDTAINSRLIADIESQTKSHDVHVRYFQRGDRRNDNIYSLFVEQMDFNELSMILTNQKLIHH